MPRESAPRRARSARLQTRGADWTIARLAEAQHGVVGRRQLDERGVGRDGIAHRLATGRLHRLHPGVYAVGHRAFGAAGSYMAAVLAGGDGAVLSHRSAALLWGLSQRRPDRPEIIVPRSSRSTPRLVRHCSRLAPDEAAVRDGIPVTCVARTLFDLATQAERREFDRALREAEFLRLPQVPSLEELYARHSRRRGARLVRHSLEGLSRLPGRGTRSPLEDRFLRLLHKWGLPVPETNVSLRFEGRTYEADCLWRQAHLIVELDGHRAHGTRSAFESDRERDRRMQVEGWTVVRVTWRQLDRPDPLVRDLRQLLSARESAAGRRQAV